MKISDAVIISTEKPVYRIAHISDTHISPEFNRYNIIKLKHLLGHIVEEGFDHIAITGDITGHGEESGYRSVRRLLKYFDLLDYEKLTVTVGNHDIFGGVHRAEDLFTFGKRCRTIDYAGKLRMFERIFRETFPKKVYSEESLFPFVKIIGPVVMIGLNSIREHHPLLNPVGSNGRVSEVQLEEAKRILGHPSIEKLRKIALVHHHFNKYRPYSDSLATTLYHKFESHTLRLHGRKNVERIFRETGVDAVLHGHTHIEGIYSRSGILYSSTALNPTKNEENGENPEAGNKLRFNEIAISDKGDIELMNRRAIAMPKGSSSRAVDKRLYGE